MDQQNPLAVLFIYHSPYHSPPFISFSLLISSLCQFINSYLPVSLSPFLSSFSTIISHFALPPFIHLQCDRVVLVTCPSRSQTATLSSWVRSADSTPYCSEGRKTETNGCRLVHANFSSFYSCIYQLISVLPSQTILFLFRSSKYNPEYSSNSMTSRRF